MRRLRYLLQNAAAALPLCLLSGCARPAPSKKASPSPSATATPFPVTVKADSVHATIHDRVGHNVVAEITAADAIVTPAHGSAPSDPIGLLTQASAILYQHGKPSATLVADKMHADRDTRIVIGTGHVKIRSLQQVDSPTIQADTMTWRYKEDSIVGEGNVLVTRQPDMRLPGKRFVADTALHRYTLYPSGAPATGTF